MILLRDVKLQYLKRRRDSDSTDATSTTIIEGVSRTVQNAAAAGRLTFRTSGAGFGTTDGDWEWYAFYGAAPVTHSVQWYPTQHNGVQLNLYLHTADLTKYNPVSHYSVGSNIALTCVTTVPNSICTCTLLILLIQHSFTLFSLI